MPRYRIYWNIGYGEMDDVIEADNLADAIEASYEAARDDFDSQAEYGAEEVEEEQ